MQTISELLTKLPQLYRSLVFIYHVCLDLSVSASWFGKLTHLSQQNLALYSFIQFLQLLIQVVVHSFHKCLNQVCNQLSNFSRQQPIFNQINYLQRPTFSSIFYYNQKREFLLKFNMDLNNRQIIILNNNQFFGLFKAQIIKDLLLMKSSISIANQFIEKAIQNMKHNKIEDALVNFQKSLKNGYSETVKNNIRVTLAALHISLHSYDKAQQILKTSYQDIQNKFNSQCKQSIDQAYIDKIDIIALQTDCRIIVNLILTNIVTQRYEQSINIFNFLLKFLVHYPINIQTQLIKFTIYLFFRTQNLDDFTPQQHYLSQIKTKNLTIWEAVCLSQFTFNQDICGYKFNQEIQILAYQTLKRYKKYDFAFFCIRHLSQKVLSQKTKIFVQKQLDMYQSTCFLSQKCDFNNQQSVQCLRCISESLKSLYLSLKEQEYEQFKKHESIKLQNLQLQVHNQIIWKLALNLNIKILKASEIQQNKKHCLIIQMNKVLKENNKILIKSMLKSEFMKKTIKQIQSKLQIILTIYQKNFRKIFKRVLKHSALHQNANVLKAKDLNIKFSSSSANISNYSFTSISINSESKQNYLYENSLKRKKIFQKNGKDIYYTQKKIQKMIKLCQYGTFLNKRNFNNDGGQFKFVKINNNFIKWGKDPEKVDQTAQMYPLKDVKGIIYGKQSPNLKKHSNKMLKDSLCFSLVLQKRTLDFYCKDYTEVEAWVCGLSQVLKNKGIKVVGYTPGKLRWRKMFAVLRQNFIQPLRRHQKNQYYYQDAYSLILLKKNNMQLPSNG